MILIKANVLFSKELDNGQIQLGLLTEQAKDIIKDLQLSIEAFDNSMVKYRTKFLEEEGYMGSDAEVKTKYGVN